MRGQANPEPIDRPLIEAASWRIRLTELGATTTLDFEIWLAQPQNAQAWAQVCLPWDFLGDQAGAPELAMAASAALADAKRAATQNKWRRDWQRAAGGIAAVLVIGMAVWGGLQWLGSPDDYATVLGERRIVTLRDGSRVALDSNSEVTVLYTKGARMLQLLRGQARFEVAHDVERPFSVLAGAQKVIATGTVFNIDVSGPKVLVTLIEGHVVVVDEKSALPAPGDAERHRSVELKAGQQLAAAPAAAPDIEPANIPRVTAWMNGQLMIDNEPLSQVVAQVNRYSTTPIEIRDPGIAAMRISGVFNTGDVAGVVDIVTHYLPVRAVNETGGAIVLERGVKS
jgi:transmembrane sensor